MENPQGNISSKDGKQNVETEKNKIIDVSKIVAVNFSRCIECEMKVICKHAFEESKTVILGGRRIMSEESRCMYELQNQRQIKETLVNNFKAFVSANPVDLLVKIQKLYGDMEVELENNPSFAKQSQLMYILMNTYKLKFGEKVFKVNMTANSNNQEVPTLDIKQMMTELRKGIDKSKEQATADDDSEE